VDIKYESLHGTGEMPLRLHADISDTGVSSTDTEDSQSSTSSYEFPSLSSLLARNDRRDKSPSTVRIPSVGSPRQDLRRVDSDEEDIYSASPKCLPVSEKALRDSEATTLTNDVAANGSMQAHQPNHPGK
jgi:hypothetical protein